MVSSNKFESALPNINHKSKIKHAINILFFQNFLNKQIARLFKWDLRLNLDITINIIFIAI